MFGQLNFIFHAQNQSKEQKNKFKPKKTAKQKKMKKKERIKGSYEHVSVFKTTNKQKNITI